MKKLNILHAILISFVMSGFSGQKFHTEAFKVDTKQSSLEWYAEKVTGKHNGTIMLLGGELINDHGKLTGTFEMDMKSIKNTDLESEKSKSKLETHLKSPDFFDVEKYPKSVFVITSVVPLNDVKQGGFTHTVNGMLTIKDKTNAISFETMISKMENKVICKGSAIVDRSKFDVRYGSKTFFADIGDKMINDEFTLKFNVVAMK